MKITKDDNLNFKKGLKAGFPVGLGYFSVSIAFGILAAQNKLPIWAPIITSMTNLSGTGQFAGFEMLFGGAGILEILFTVFMLNIRYFLMGITLSQKLPQNISFGKRMIIAFGLTDENFAIEISQRRELTFSFICGLILSSWCGWVSGTIVGALLNSLIPAMLMSAMGIMLYAMFMAIFVPEARKSKAVLVVVIISLVLSSGFKWIPFVNKIPNSWAIIISGVVAAIIGAILFPIKNENLTESCIVDDKTIMQIADAAKVDAQSKYIQKLSIEEKEKIVGNNAKIIKSGDKNKIKGIKVRKNGQ